MEIGFNESLSRGQVYKKRKIKIKIMVSKQNYYFPSLLYPDSDASDWTRKKTINPDSHCNAQRHVGAWTKRITHSKCVTVCLGLQRRRLIRRDNGLNEHGAGGRVCDECSSCRRKHVVTRRANESTARAVIASVAPSRFRLKGL